MSHPDSRQADVGGVAGDQLRSIVERIERLEEEKKALQEDIKDIYAEAKGNGFDVKILRKIIAMRKRDRAELDEEETILTLYLRALGMLPEEIAAATRGEESSVEELFAGLVSASMQGDVRARTVVEAARVGGAEMMVAVAGGILAAEEARG